MELVVATLADINAKPKRTGADHDGYVPYWGYRGPRLSDLSGARPVDAEMLVESLRRVKSAPEIACIQLSCDWAARGHRRMQGAIRTGKTEMECYVPAATETLFEMVTEMPGWRACSWLASSASRVRSAITSATRSGSRATRRLSSTAVMTPCSSPGWCSPSSRACT